MNHPNTLLDWKTQAARDLELMRVNTERWQRDGLLKTPGEVKIHAAKVMSIKLARPRKGDAG